jgi:hypothetical protein
VQDRDDLRLAGGARRREVREQRRRIGALERRWRARRPRCGPVRIQRDELEARQRVRGSVATTRRTPMRAARRARIAGRVVRRQRRVRGGERGERERDDEVRQVVVNRQADALAGLDALGAQPRGTSADPRMELAVRRDVAGATRRRAPRDARARAARGSR